MKDPTFLLPATPIYSRNDTGRSDGDRGEQDEETNAGRCESGKLILQMCERYTCIRKQIDIAEHNEKYTARCRELFVFSTEIRRSR